MRVHSHRRGSIAQPMGWSLALIGVVIFPGCGTTNSNVNGSGVIRETPSMVVSLAANTTPIVTEGEEVSITASVANDSSNQGVIWTLEPSSAHGMLNNMTTTSATFSAPTDVAAAEYVTVVATSVADPQKAASMTVTLKPQPAVAAALPASDSRAAATATQYPTGGGMRIIRPPANTSSAPAPDRN